MRDAGSVTAGKTLAGRVKDAMARQGLLGMKAAIKTGKEEGKMIAHKRRGRKAPYNK